MEKAFQGVHAHEDHDGDTEEYHEGAHYHDDGSTEKG